MKPILINLDLKNNGYNELELKQGCQDTLIATISDLGEVVSLVGQVISIEMLKADNTFIIQSTDITVLNNTLTIKLNKDLTRVSGKGKLQIKMTKDTIITGSWVVNVRIRKGAIDNTVEESGNVVTIKEALDTSIGLAVAENAKTENLIKTGGAASKLELAETNSHLADIQNNELNSLFKPEDALKLNFISDDGHLSIFSGDKASNGVYTIKTDGSTGFVTTDWGYNTTNYSMPIGVIIGDSIAEGHPGAHGRLDILGGGYDLAKENERGQISYHLERLVGTPLMNHGIGGQTTTQIKARWNRDALAQDVVGLVPTKTLDFKPFYVAMVMGINDVFGGILSPTIIANLEYMIDSAISNNIVPVVFTVGTHTLMDPPKLTVVKEVNSWIKEKALKTPQMSIFDFYEYSNDILNEGKPKSGIFADAVHPTKGIYQDISNIIYKTVFGKKVSKPKYLNLSTELFATTTINSVSRPILVKIIINDVKQNIVLLPENEYVSISLSNKEPIKKIGIQLIAGKKTDMTLNDTYLKNLYVSEFFITEKPFSQGIISDEMILRTTIASIGIGRLLIDNGIGTLTFANVDNLKRIVGVNQKATTGSDYIVTKGYCYLNLSEVNGALTNGDLLMTTTSGMAKKVTDISTQNIIGRVYKMITTTFAICELF